MPYNSRGLGEAVLVGGIREWDSWRRQNLIWASENEQTSLKQKKNSPGQGHRASEGREVGMSSAEEQQSPESRGGLGRTRERLGEEWNGAHLGH